GEDVRGDRHPPATSPTRAGTLGDYGEPIPLVQCPGAASRGLLQLPHSDLIGQRLSMRIGDSYDIRKIGMADWRKLARECTIEEDRVLTMLTDMAKALPDEVSSARDRALLEGLSESIV